MNEATKQTYWDLALNGTLCDLTLVEKSASGETKEHSVHKLIVYTASPYFKAFFDQDMGDKDTNRIVIDTESPELGPLSIVIKAMYSPPSRAESIYYTYTGEHNITDVMYLYMICTFLQLKDHCEYLQDAIAEFINIGDLTRWWRDRKDIVPVGIEEMVQKHLRDSVKYIGSVNEAFISVPALLNLWPNIDDPISKNICDFLGSIVETAEDIDDNPSGWLSDESGNDIASDPEDTFKDCSCDGNMECDCNEEKCEPSLVPFDNERWIDKQSNYIFIIKEEQPYVISKYDDITELQVPLTIEDKITIIDNGWKLKR